MNNPIDIVVTWVDNSIPKWQEEFKYWKEKELSEQKQSQYNLDAWGDARYRSWDVFKYWFRGVAENCKWVNRVFLIVEDKDHVPDWLDTECNKLRIVEHKEFIPEEILPCFNGPVIDLWYSRIPDLSDNFIVCDDDFYFFNPTDAELFFENNTPCSSFSIKSYEPRDYFLKYLMPVWNCTLHNTKIYANNYLGNINKYVENSHFPEARSKSRELEILDKCYDDFLKASTVSHFRHKDNIQGDVFVEILKLSRVTINKNTYYKAKYINLIDREYDNIIEAFISNKYNIICFNDIQELANENLNLTLKNLFKNKFPNKCYFER